MFSAGGLGGYHKDAGDKALSVGSLVLDAFNPLGSGSFLQMLTPTVADPLVAISTNKDAFGRPIYKEDKALAPTPGWERSRESATAFSKVLAEMLDYMTSESGTKYTKGWLSPTADQIDYLIGQATGGVGREVMKAGEFGAAIIKGETGEVPSYRVPVVGKLYGETESQAAVSSKFYENVIEMAKHEHEIKMRRKNREDISEYVTDHPEAGLWQRANNVENQVNAINKQIKVLQEKDAPKERIENLKEKKTELMKKYNNKVREAR
jgi:hypothetical protein